jgi:hypothetical protein
MSRLQFTLLLLLHSPVCLASCCCESGQFAFVMFTFVLMLQEVHVNDIRGAVEAAKVIEEAIFSC